MARKQVRGVTLLEVLVAAVLIGVGFVATFQCLGALADSQRRTLESETMQRLALQTYDQILTMGSLTTGSTDGDFVDTGENRYVWHAEREPAGVGNLDILRVEVGRRGDEFRHAQKIQGLICRAGSS